MKTLNSYESLVNSIITENAKRPFVVIDLKFYLVKKKFFKSRGFIYHHATIGSARARDEAWAKLERDFLDTDIAKFLAERNYYLKRGNKFLLAVKENTLNLYDKE